LQILKLFCGTVFLKNRIILGLEKFLQTLPQESRCGSTGNRRFFTRYFHTKLALLLRGGQFCISILLFKGVFLTFCSPWFCRKIAVFWGTKNSQKPRGAKALAALREIALLETLFLKAI